MPHDPVNRVLLTGATGYVGGRLLRALEQRGHRLRCLVLEHQPLKSPVSSTTEIVSGDVRNFNSVRAAMQGIHTAYFLVYVPALRGPFEDGQRKAANTFAAAAREAGVRRIIYLGGLNSGGHYSSQLCDAGEIGEILRRSGAQVVEFRSPIIVGSGSLTYELARDLVERMPIMALPRWTRALTRPIAIEDVIAYLAAALEMPHGNSEVFEIGGADCVSFSELLREYARQRQLRRLLMPLPVNMPRLSILWLSTAAPAFARIGQELVANLCAPKLSGGLNAAQVFAIRPRGIRAAIERALQHEGQPAPLSEWRDALPSNDGKEPQQAPFGPRIVDSRSASVDSPPAQAFLPIQRIGGEAGWYYADWLWQLRALLDVALGAESLRRGRRDAETLEVGDPIDLWRVEACEPGLLRLAAEMKLPGRAWLQFEVEEQGSGACIRQTAIFDPIGLAGLLYWYLLYPAHELIFPGMLRGITRASRRSARSEEPVPQAPASMRPVR